MQIVETPLAGLKLIRLPVHEDARGFFVERFNAGRFAAACLPTHFVQDNHSRTIPGVVRGLHYQSSPPQGKLVGVMRGRIWDVAVDIRPDSLTYGEHYAVELTGENGLLLWMPPGFAHGFCVLGEEPADMLYKVSGNYNAAGEGGIRYDDADLGIAWPVAPQLLSARDQQLQSFAEYRRNPPRWP